MVMVGCLGFKGTGKSGVNQQNPQRDGTVESHVFRKVREAWARTTIVNRREAWCALLVQAPRLRLGRKCLEYGGNMNSQQVRRAILDKMLAGGIDRNNPESAFVVANFTRQRRQGPLVNAFADQMKAESYALEIFTGHTDVYVMSVNPQYGLWKVVDGKLAFVEEDAVTGAA